MMNTEFEHFEKVVEETAQEPASTTTETQTEEQVQTEEVLVTEEAKETSEKVVVDEAKTEEVIVADPLADLPDDVKEYAIAKKENKDLTFEDFQKEKNFDISSLSVLDVAREKAIRENGGKITKENVDAYLEKKTGIVLTDEDVELDEYDEIDLEKFVGDFRESFGKKTEEEVTEEEKEEVQPKEELIEVENGFKIEKTVYENLQKAQEQYVSRMEKSVAEVNETSFSIEFDNNGTKEIMPVSYTTTEADKQLMLSTTKNVNVEVDKMFRDKDGNFNDKQFAESILWLTPSAREKMISTLIHKAVAISTEKLLKQEYNANFQAANFKQETNPQPKKQTTVYRPPGTLQVDVV
nr:hypothetical protein [uncultured Flavobacterium sp.]